MRTSSRLARGTTALSFALGLLSLGCKDWRTEIEAGLAAESPAQGPLLQADERVALRLPAGAQGEVIAKASYALKAWIVAKDHPSDAFSDLAPIDLSLAWGQVADPAVMRHLKFHLKRRYISVRWGQRIGLDSRQVMQQLSNHHFVPANAAAKEALEQVRPGNLIAFEGYLVDVKNSEGRVMRSSLTRRDVGNGACEVVWLESLRVLR